MSIMIMYAFLTSRRCLAYGCSVTSLGGTTTGIVVFNNAGMPGKIVRHATQLTVKDPEIIVERLHDGRHDLIVTDSVGVDFVEGFQGSGSGGHGI